MNIIRSTSNNKSMMKGKQQEKKKGHQEGFTLLELLVIIAILAAVAFITTGTFQGVQEDANDQLVRSEMQQIVKAIRRFKQDTGYYPKTGPFNLSNYGGDVTYASLPSWAGSNNAEKDLWFYSPANFYQLISRSSPLSGTSHQLENWDLETGRGWRGPYVKGFAEGYIDIGADINHATTGDPNGNPSGNPENGTFIPDVDGLADPFEHRPVTVGGNTVLDWSATARLPNPPGRVERESWGQPYMCFDLDSSPWLTSMGLNGFYDQGNDDIVLDIE